MVLINPKPTSAGRRSMIKVVSPELYKGKPYEPLLEKQNKYAEMHAALMQLKGRLSEKAVFQIAKEVGLDTEQLQEDMMDPKILNHLTRTRELGKRLMIRGTPAFIINSTISPGALTKHQLLELIAQARDKR